METYLFFILKEYFLMGFSQIYIGTQWIYMNLVKDKQQVELSLLFSFQNVLMFLFAIS
jgi:hypothetical protein